MRVINLTGKRGDRFESADITVFGLKSLRKSLFPFNGCRPRGDLNWYSKTVKHWCVDDYRN